MDTGASLRVLTTWAYHVVANWDLYVNSQPHQDILASANTMLVNASLLPLPCADAQVVVFIENKGNQIV